MDGEEMRVVRLDGLLTCTPVCSIPALPPLDLAVERVSDPLGRGKGLGCGQKGIGKIAAILHPHTYTQIAIKTRPPR